MAKKMIITIARQYGSGGREIGEKVAKILGILVKETGVSATNVKVLSV